MVDPNAPLPQPMLADSPAPAKPQAVTTGALLYYASLTFGALGTILRASDASAAPLQRRTDVLIPGILLGFAIFGGLVIAASKGQNWARITLLVIFLIALPFGLFGDYLLLGTAPLQGIISIVQQALQGVGLYFLFSAPATAWYRSRR